MLLVTVTTSRPQIFGKMKSEVISKKDLLYILVTKKFVTIN
jgi:hypothetical protein